MKKVFKLQQENKNPDRLLEAIKNEVRKYLKRERNKKLPEDAIFWDFDCRFGQSSDEAEGLSVSEIIAALDKAHEAAWSQCYVEIIAKASMKKETDSDEEE
ncbi:MAG: DUF6172 family protein [Sulfurimonadaceae bacterium]